MTEHGAVGLSGRLKKKVIRANPWWKRLWRFFVRL